MAPVLKRQRVTIVFRGEFIPTIVTPGWLAFNNLIRENEANTAEINIISNAATLFSIDWLRVEITPDRWLFGTVSEPYFEALRDLAMGCMKLLQHTPLRSMGINREYDYQVESIDRWHHIGDTLVPKDQPWKAIGENPGLLSLTVQYPKIDEKYDGYINVKVGPSLRLMDEGQYGVFIEVNDHHDFQDEENLNKRVTSALSALADEWSRKMDFSIQVAEKIVFIP